MGVLISTNFTNQLDRRISRIVDQHFAEEASMLPMLFDVRTARKGENEIVSMEGDLGDFTEFMGTIDYQETFEQYKTTATHKEWNNGLVIGRKLIDDALFGNIERKAGMFGRSAARTKEKHAARLLNRAFSLDNLFYSTEEGKPLCSDTHLTKSGASTATGFDNLGTAAISATTVEANRIAMRQFRGDVGQIISVSPTELWIPTNLYGPAYEIVSSLGSVKSGADTSNKANVHYGQYSIHEWQYLTDANNWFMMDGSMRQKNHVWYERIPLEFTNVEDFDTFNRKYRAYMRYSYHWLDWRHIYGNEVA